MDGTKTIGMLVIALATIADVAAAQYVTPAPASRCRDRARGGGTHWAMRGASRHSNAV
jgi:hypothetical protein